MVFTTLFDVHCSLKMQNSYMDISHTSMDNGTLSQNRFCMLISDMLFRMLDRLHLRHIVLKT